MLLHAFGVFCGLGATALAAMAASNPSRCLALAAGFIAASFWFGLTSLPDPVAVSGFIAVATVIVLIKPAWILLAIVFGGAGAWLWAAVLHAQGLPAPVAVVIAAGLPAAVVVLASRNAGFAPALIQEEALLFVAVIGLLLAGVPGLIAGWNAAVALKAVPLAEGGAASSAPVLILTIGLLLLGGLRSYWKRR